MSQEEKRVQPRTQASPLAQDVLALLQGQLRGIGPGATSYGGYGGGIRGDFGSAGGGGGGVGGAISQVLEAAGITGGGPRPWPGPEFGLGLTPLQREAGTAARQFVASGGGAFDVSPLLAQLEEIQRRRVGETLADIREGFGVAGSRFGTPVAIGQAKAAREMETQFGAQVGELLRQEFASQQQRMLQGITLLQNIGQQNLEPFLRFAAMGIVPEQITYQQSPIVTGIQTAGDVAGSILPFI